MLYYYQKKRHGVSIRVHTNNIHYIIFDNEINTASPLESHRQLYIYYAVCVCYEAPIYQKWLNPYGAVTCSPSQYEAFTVPYEVVGEHTILHRLQRAQHLTL